MSSTEGGVGHGCRHGLLRVRLDQGSVNTNASLWHPWLRINRVLRVMLHTRWNAEAWSVVRVEFRKALALRSEIRRAEWFN